MGISPDHKEDITGAGGSISYEISQNNKVMIDEVKLEGVNLVLNDLTRLKTALEYDLDGIMGYPIMHNYITEIDYIAKELRLYKKGTTLDLSTYTKHKFEFNNNINIPQLDLEITLENNETLGGKVFFDSGAGLRLLVNTPFKIKHDLIKKSERITNVNSDNLSKTSSNQIIDIKALKLGQYSFDNIAISLSSDKAGVSAFEGYLGILGAGIINKFNVILDYDNKVLYLKPNANYLK